MRTQKVQRQQIPNSQIRDSADSFKAGWDLLNIQQSGSGFILPQINVGAIAIELYLKSLSAFVVETPDRALDEAGWAFVTVNDDDDELNVVTASDDDYVLNVVTADPKLIGHGFRKIFNEIDSDIQKDIKIAFLSHSPSPMRTFHETITALEGAYQESRYSFQTGHD